jgi:predicted nucleotidyltransferase component of viral defense system
VADNYIEAFAGKFRVLAGRTRPRDFYDVVKLYRNIDVRKEPSGVRRISYGKNARSKTYHSAFS